MTFRQLHLKLVLSLFAMMAVVAGVGFVYLGQLKRDLLDLELSQIINSVETGPVHSVRLHSAAHQR
jgi:hypothetical protein